MSNQPKNKDKYTAKQYIKKLLSDVKKKLKTPKDDTQSKPTKPNKRSKPNKSNKSNNINNIEGSLSSQKIVLKNDGLSTKGKYCEIILLDTKHVITHSTNKFSDDIDDIIRQHTPENSVCINVSTTMSDEMNHAFECSNNNDVINDILIDYDSDRVGVLNDLQNE